MKITNSKGFQIGNYVLDEDNELARLCCLYSGKLVTYEDCETFFGRDEYSVEYDGKNGIYLSSVINPVPVTPELLVDLCGFKKVENTKGWGDCFAKGSLTIGFGKVVTISVSGQQLNFYRKGRLYLHKLQNLYESIFDTPLNITVKLEEI